MIRLWRQRPVLTSAFALACAVTLFFAGSLVYHAVYWAGHRNVDLKGWMTVGYIARSWDIPAPELDALANLPGPKIKGHPQPLAEIARDRGVPVAQVIDEVNAAIAMIKARHARP
jgi:hypothetical protein